MLAYSLCSTYRTGAPPGFLGLHILGLYNLMLYMDNQKKIAYKTGHTPWEVTVRTPPGRQKYHGDCQVDF